ncbi:protein of unknown function [Actinacidiphila yanglinensis]|uniref:DUF4429 domain-containing protein n=1 Tax=Actinacidiphila yanglinensis TaxID=310779 RepID=A0A1H5SET3_9ACTN|nr:DUF4429 domain-containing protein [Actinacidiphila yanglinensis]SEF48924.1 protein of unknown function [Actinacidiphila yanglinensis]
MGEVLAGNNAVWDCEPDAVVIRYSRGLRGSRLLQALGERRVPYEALEDVELADGRPGSLILRAAPRPGSDPLIEAADGQLRESADPYRLVLPEQSRADAETFRDLLRDAIRSAEVTAKPAGRFLVPAPAVPRSFKAYDAKATFDGRAVGFHWFRTGASTAKWNSGDRTFPVEDLAGVDWHSPERVNGHLRLLLREPVTPLPPADQDPASVIFGLGYGSVHESLPFAAAVLAAIRTARVRP